MTIRPRADRDDEAIVKIVNSVNPDRIPLTLERFRSSVGSQPPTAFLEIDVAEVGGEVVGYLWLNRLIYVPDPNVWYAELLVRADAHGRGTGSRLYEHLLGRLHDAHAGRVISAVREDLATSRAFAVRRGFCETGHAERPSRLDVEAAHIEPGRRAAEKLDAEGIHIATLADLGGDGEEILRRLHALAIATYADKPRFEELTAMPFEEWRRIRTERREQPALVWIAVEANNFVGMATLLQQNADSARAGYTAVAKTHRGRGIARALKYFQVRWARENRIRYLYTENDTHNAPMLRVNTTIGYKPLPADLEVMKEFS